MPELRLVKDGPLEGPSDMPGTLRRIADDIQSGAVPEAARAVVVVDTPHGLAVYGLGDCSTNAEAYFILALGLQDLLKLSE